MFIIIWLCSLSNGYVGTCLEEFSGLNHQAMEERNVGPVSRKLRTQMLRVCMYVHTLCAYM